MPRAVPSSRGSPRASARASAARFRGMAWRLTSSRRRRLSASSPRAGTVLAIRSLRKAPPRSMRQSTGRCAAGGTRSRRKRYVACGRRTSAKGPPPPTVRSTQEWSGRCVPWRAASPCSAAPAATSRTTTSCRLSVSVPRPSIRATRRGRARRTRAIPDKRSRWGVGAWAYDRVGYAIAAFEIARSRGAREVAGRASFNLALAHRRRGEVAETAEAYRGAIRAGHPDASPRAAAALGVLLQQQMEQIGRGQPAATRRWAAPDGTAPWLAWLSA